MEHRSIVDGDTGQVYIYVGGVLPVGTHPIAFQFMFDFVSSAGNSTGYIAPLLLERQISGAYVLFTVVGIGRAFPVSVNSAPQSIPFEIIKGDKVVPNANIVFGFVNAVVNASGDQLAASAGTLDFGQPPDSGQGVGGAGTTNDWSATSTHPAPVVALGTTFGAPLSGADYTFFGSYRTYSAEATGVVLSQ